MIAKPNYNSKISVSNVTDGKQTSAGAPSRVNSRNSLIPAPNLRSLVIAISKFNDGDSLEGFAEHTSFDILLEINPMLCTDELFVITDDPRTADTAAQYGIGFAGYLSDEKISDGKVINEFPYSLYLITSLSELTDKAIIRMYDRSAGIPWQIVETARTIVREITVSDIDDLYDIYDDEETSKYIEKLFDDKKDEIEFTHNYINNQYKYFEYGLWAVTDRQTGALIGRAGIFNREGYEDPEFGFMFERSMWGKGIAYEVCTAILDYVKAEFGFTTFNAFTKKENVRGKKLLERLNFKYNEEKTLGEEQFDMYIYTTTPDKL